MGKYRGIEAFLSVCGILSIFTGLVMLAVVPLVKVWEQQGIHTYHHQAMLAATPLEFGMALTGLDQALENAGMVSGATNAPWMEPSTHQNMTFTRQRIQAFALHAERFAAYNPASIEASTGLAGLQKTLGATDIPAYGFWFWSKGGIWYALYIPVLCFLGGIGLIGLASLLPNFIPRRSESKPSPA